MRLEGTGLSPWYLLGDCRITPKILVAHPTPLGANFRPAFLDNGESEIAKPRARRFCLWKDLEGLVFQRHQFRGVCRPRFLEKIGDH